MLSDMTTLQRLSGQNAGDEQDIPNAPMVTKTSNVGRPHAKSLNGVSTAPPPVGDFPPPKADKPRPHVCAVCTRSFARLEHLKRHERSHTKEKPFECPECTRCFARRDLLLRHQQKLHSSTTPSSRPRSGRRESTSSTITNGPSKVRKNSVSNGLGVAGMRPRANTISHVDNGTLGMMAAANTSVVFNGGANPIRRANPTVNRMPRTTNLGYRGMSTAVGHHGIPGGLPKLETRNLQIDLDSGLRTAPAFNHLGFGTDVIFGPGHTINPAALHFTDSPNPLAFEDPSSPFSQAFSEMPPAPMVIDECGNVEWIGGFDSQLSLINTNETAITGSSPSAVDTDSPGGNSEALQESYHQTSGPWHNSLFAKAPPLLPDYMIDISFSDHLVGKPPSPPLMPDFAGGEAYLSQTRFHLQGPVNQVHGLSGPLYSQSLPSADTPMTMDSAGSNRTDSVASTSPVTITEATRQALILALAQPSTFNQRKQSQHAMASPLSPGFGPKPHNASFSLSSTSDLQRYISAYVKYFHPHCPFLHIPSLSFESSTYSNDSHPSSDRSSSPVSCVASGGGCLILAMSAIGALYEYDLATSKELFSSSKRLITLYLEERRKADMAKVLSGSKQNTSVQNTPVWLVQCMLLNVIYGHNCGDKTSENIATTHGAALVGLARSAGLANPPHHQDKSSGGEVPLREQSWSLHGEDSVWYNWRVVEEKKRTLYAVFVMSSMLTSAYNHPPAMTNSEIQLDLPCDEELWAAESPEAWYALGGSVITEQQTIPFSQAFGALLTARERQQYQPHQMSQAYCRPVSQILETPQPEFHASTFGCLVLINALHNYIWETRQRHVGREWSPQETDDMHNQIEPALAAWQAVWASNPHHSLERPNPFGHGPLSTDSIPLLDLAYLRLYVSLGRSKEAFWQRDYDEMSREIAKGYDIIQHAGSSPHSTDISASFRSGRSDMGRHMSLRRERHLRKAALHAAHSLIMSDRMGTTFADFNSRELPITAAMCAFDCAQVLSEWVATVQERVGQHLGGILGKDNIDFNIETNPGMILLEQEDIALLAKIEEILEGAELKMARDITGRFAGGNRIMNETLSAQDCGYSAKILLTVARMLDNSSVWPAIRLMGHSLSIQAAHMRDRAEKSVLDHIGI